MPSASIAPRHLAMTAALCGTLAIPSALSAGSAACGAAPVIGREGAVLYWTGGTGCVAAEPSQGEQDSAMPRDEAPVSRNSATPDPAPAPMPETRPLTEAVSVAG